MNNNGTGVSSDILLIFELSLSIGQSLDLKENCQAFVDVLMARKDLAYTAIWIAMSQLHGLPDESGYELVYAVPAMRAVVRRAGAHDASFDFDTNGRFRVVRSGDPDFDAVVEESGVKGGAYALFKLGDFGLLKLYSRRETSFSVRELNQLSSVVGKFAVTLEGALSHKRLLTESAEREAAQHSLKRQTALLRSLIDSVPDLIFYKDNDSVYLGCNRAFGVYSDRKETDIIGRTDYDFFDRETAEFFRAKDAEMRAAGTPRRNEEWIEYPDGRRVLLDTLKTPYHGPDGEILGLIGISRDITERKQAELQLARSKDLLDSVINSIADPIFVKDEKHRFALANDAVCTLVGRSRDEMLGKSDYDFFPKAQADVFWAQDDLVIHSSEPNINEEEITGSNGTLTISTVKSSFKNPMTGMRNLVGTIRDLTAQKQTEQVLRRAQKVDAIGQLTGGIAHDFNNILGIIMGNIGLLRRQLAGDAKVGPRVDAIRKATKRAADLTEQLLGFSRRQSTQSVITDIGRVIKEMDSLIARSLTPEVEVEHYIVDDLWLTEIDLGDFEDTMLNLVLNARDAMPGGGRLTIEAHNCTLEKSDCVTNPGTTPGEYVQLAVTDSGEGIPSQHLERIFEPFFTTKPHGEGTGLGLAMVYGFVHRSNAHIKVYSDPGIGTTFRLYLPRSPEDRQAIEAPAEESNSLPRGRETVLVVDDEVSLSQLAQDILQPLGYRVLTAENGKRALQRLAEGSAIDLLFSDVVMPGGINGYELAERAATIQPRLKVLLTSGYSEKTPADRGQARYSVNLLSKPYNPNDLAKRVRMALDARAPIA